MGRSSQIEGRGGAFGCARWEISTAIASSYRTSLQMICPWYSRVGKGGRTALSLMPRFTLAMARTTALSLQVKRQWCVLGVFLVTFKNETRF